MAPPRLALLQFCACVALSSCAYVAQPPAPRRTRTAGISAAELASADLPTSPKATAESPARGAGSVGRRRGARDFAAGRRALLRRLEADARHAVDHRIGARDGDLELACSLVEVFQNERDACCVVLPDEGGDRRKSRLEGHGHTPRIETLGARQGLRRRRLRRQGRRRRAARAGARAADDARRARGGEGARRPRRRAPLHRAQRLPASPWLHANLPQSSPHPILGGAFPRT